jgi:AcrR family transcriptional regulator
MMIVIVKVQRYSARVGSKKGRPPAKGRTGGRKPTAQEVSRDGAGAGEAAGTRDRMVAGAARLLAERGLQATSFSEVLEVTKAPRGSVYHHFPGGKDQLVEAALELVSAQMAKAFAPSERASPSEITSLFLAIWRSILVRSRFRAGCAVVAVTVAAESPGLHARTEAIFRGWRGQITERFVKAGLPRKQASMFAATLIAASEGAVILSRAEQSIEPFELVAAQLLEQANALGGHTPSTSRPDR